jgi:uncharacterized YccA/Bax inhibitor family protein
MANPYFSNSANFGKSTPQPGSVGVGYQPNAQGYAQQSPYGTPSPYGQPGTYDQTTDAQFQQVQDAYNGPAATAAQTGRLTYDDVIMKTATVLGAIVLTAALAWFAFSTGVAPIGLLMPVMIVGLIGGLVLGLVNSFKREPSPALILGYAVFEGAFLGLISMVFELTWPGIVIQAVLATFITFGVTLALFRSGKIRVTPKFRKILTIGLISYGIFALVNLVLGMMGVGEGWGLRTGGLGLLIGAVAVVLAAMTLVMDFDQIQRGVANGVARKYAWSAAFGIALSLVWLYLEFLRILAILRGD